MAAAAVTMYVVLSQPSWFAHNTIPHHHTNTQCNATQRNATQRNSTHSTTQHTTNNPQCTTQQDTTRHNTHTTHKHTTNTQDTSRHNTPTHTHKQHDAPHQHRHQHTTTTGVLLNADLRPECWPAHRCARLNQSGKHRGCSRRRWRRHRQCPPPEGATTASHAQA